MTVSSGANQSAYQIDICLAVDSMYATGAQLTCYSVLQNLDILAIPMFHLIVNEKNHKFEQEFTSTLDRCGRKYRITFYTIDESQFTDLPDFFFPSKMTYARLVIPELLDVKNVIYIDSDILVLKDLARLSREFVPGIWCKAVIDLSTKTIRGELHDLEFPDINLDAPAINGGLLVLDVGMLRKNGKFRDALALLICDGDALRNHDQSAINVVLNGKFEQLGSSWNYMVNHFPKNIEKLRVAQEGINFHFVTAQKPWLMTRPVLPFILFYRYARRCGLLHRMSVTAFRVSFAQFLFWSPSFARLYFTLKSVIAKFRGNHDVACTIQDTIETLNQTSHIRQEERSLLKRFG